MKDLRRLVTLRTINKLEPIEGADRIEVATIGGWKSVVNKGVFTVGEQVVYFEIDSFLPTSQKQFEHLTRGQKTITDPNGQTVKGHVLKTIRLRGQISQGLVLPLHVFDADLVNFSDDEFDTYFKNLGVFKYDPYIARKLSNSQKSTQDPAIIGAYPEHTLKTDSERVQNLTDEFLQKLQSEATKIVASEKVDGMSTTFWKDASGTLRYATRNYERDLTIDVEASKIAKEYRLDEILQPNETVKAELYGEGIQGNPLKIVGKKLAIFDWESPTRDLPNELVPYQTKFYDFELPDTVEETVAQVRGLKSLINPNVLAEGVVYWIYPRKEYRALKNRSNFKAINDEFLIR